MVAMTHYQVTAERTNNWWVLQALDAPGAISQVSRFDQADQIIEAIAFVTGEQESDITIDVQPIIPEAATRHLEAAARLRAESLDANRRSALESRSAAQMLYGTHMSLRDIGKILGASHQRAH